MSKLETRVDQLDPGFRIGPKGELDGIGEGVLELIDWLALVSKLRR